MLEATGAAGIIAKPFDPMQLSEQIGARSLEERAMSSLDDALAAIWERSRPLVAERLATVEAAARRAGPTTRPGRRALRAAHQLAGSLGTFGLHEGSDVARAIEHELEGAADPARARRAQRPAARAAGAAAGVNDGALVRTTSSGST